MIRGTFPVLGRERLACPTGMVPTIFEEANSNAGPILKQYDKLGYCVPTPGLNSAVLYSEKTKVGNPTIMSRNLRYFSALVLRYFQSSRWP